jgi:hypothetical protein
LRFNFVIFEIDSQTLVNAFNSNNLRVSGFNSFVAASIIKFLSLFSNFDVEFVILQTNMVALSLEITDESPGV